MSLRRIRTIWIIIPTSDPSAIMNLIDLVGRVLGLDHRYHERFLVGGDVALELDTPAHCALVADTAQAERRVACEFETSAQVLGGSDEGEQHAVATEVETAFGRILGGCLKTR
jgi:hypothetical protein